MSPDWDDAPVGLLVLDSSGTVLAANRTAAAWAGTTREELTDGRRLPDLLSVAGRMFWETHLSPLLRLGEDLAEVSLELRSPAGRLPVLLSSRPYRAEGAGDGDVLVALAGAGHRAEYERRLRAASREAQAAATAVRGLQAVTAALSAAVGLRAVGRAVVTSAVEVLGARSAQLWLSEDGRLRLAASFGDDDDDGDGDDGNEEGGVGGVVELTLRGQTVLHGVLRLSQRLDPGADPVDTDLAIALGRQASLALDRAASYERTASIAHQLQRSLLAAPVPRDPRVSVATVYRPGVETLDVGGDWYDVFRDDVDRLSFVVGDVVGRGLGAAAAMGQLRSAVRAVAGVGVEPAALLERLDAFVDQLPPAEMATVAYGVLDLATGELGYACAGHLPPVLVPAAGPARLLWEGRGTPLSGFLGGRRSGARLRLAPGDRLVLCTDGLVERRDRSLDQGLQALLGETEALRGVPGTAAAPELTRRLLVDEVVRDDVCVLLLDWLGPGEHPATRPPPRAAAPHLESGTSRQHR